MKKSKGQTIDLLYVNKAENNKKKTKTDKNKKRPSKKEKIKAKKSKNNNNEKINLDKEIIIGLTPKPTENKKPENKKTKKNNKKSNKKNKTKPKKTQKNKTNKKQTQKQKIRNKIIKWVVILLLIITAITLFMLSSIFNIKQINVTNNSKITSQEIINLSTLQTGVNMFKTTNKTIKNAIKTNPYVDDVKITRNINGTITLEISERTVTYMLKLEDTYAYINNQGYILEISEKQAEVPVILGYKTPKDQIKPGNRLIEEDLLKLQDIIKIVETAKNVSLSDKITQIDITNTNDYILTLSKESKTVRIGDTTNINIKLGLVNIIINEEKGKSGEIYFQNDGKAVFREEV